VQCKIKRVFYLPIEPEYKDLKDETSGVDELFKASPIAQSVFVPIVDLKVIVESERKRNISENKRGTIQTKLMDLYHKDEWINTAKDNLPWPAFEEEMKGDLRIYFDNMMKWIATIEAIEGDTFQESSLNKTPIPFDTSVDSKKASFLITMARFLAERSDDPRTGVGAVITNTEFEIVALGWNGFPTKALYGEFPRASQSDQVERKKYPFTIHAEQNALLLRNTKNLTNGILFITKTPCDECTPLLAMERIKTVFLGEKMNVKGKSQGTLGYQKFAGEVRKGTFICFEVAETSDEEASGEEVTGVRRNLSKDL